MEEMSDARTLSLIGRHRESTRWLRRPETRPLAEPTYHQLITQSHIELTFFCRGNFQNFHVILESSKEISKYTFSENSDAF